MSDFVTILTFPMLIATFVMFAVAFVSALNAVQIGGWRRLWSGPIGWFHPPPGLDPAVCRQKRRAAMCFFGAIACMKLQTFLLQST